MIKPTIGIHSGTVNNQKSFNQAYQHVQNNPGIIYNTIPGGVPFEAKATIATRAKGNHRNQQVIRFFSRGTEMARAYECCWGHISNCYKTPTHINVYSTAI